MGTVVLFRTLENPEVIGCLAICQTLIDERDGEGGSGVGV